MTSEQVRKYPSGLPEVKRRMTMPERIEEYKAKIEELEDAREQKSWVFGKDVDAAKVRQVKSDLASLREGLKKDLDAQAEEYHKALAKVLSPEQKAWGPVPELEEDTTLFMLDWLTRWGLTVLGACLLIGLFTRTSCLLAASFLVLTSLAYPPFPWLSAPPQSEGNYLFVNKNLVELFALLVLMTARTGRWFGLDALVHRCWQLVSGERDTKDTAAQAPRSAA